MTTREPHEDPSLSIELDEKVSLSFDDKTEEHISSTDEMLKVDVGGCWGCIERIPLPVKLIVMCAVSLFGLLFFSVTVLVMDGVQVKVAKDGREAALFMRDLSLYINGLQYERLNSNAMIILRSEFYRNETIKSIAAVNKIRERFYGQSHKHLREKFGAQFSEVTERIKSYEPMIIQQREAYLANISNVVVEDNYMLYTTGIEMLLTAQAKTAQLANIGVKGNNYMLYSRMVEAKELVKNAGGYTFSIQYLDLEGFANFHQRSVEYAALELVWKQTTSEEIFSFFNSTVVPSPIIVQATEYMSNIDRSTFPEFPTIDVIDYVNNMTVLVEKMKVLETILLNDIIQEKQNTYRTAYVSIAVFSTLTFVLAVISIALAILLAFSIVGPWIRLNRIQETAISRFVPKGFLKLLGCERITDLKLGKSVEREITMMDVEIRDFDSISKNMKSDQVFNMLNSYLSIVGPVIRKHGGFIDKYRGERFTALFKDAARSVRSCLEIQSAVEAFNLSVKDQFPAIGVGSSVHSDNVLIGAVGENERMDGVVLNTRKNVNSILNKLASTFKAPLIVTKHVLERCSRWRTVNYRKIGSISANGRTSSDTMEVFEIIPSNDPLKLSTKPDFENGIASFEQGYYGDATKNFEQVLQQNPGDSAADLYHKRSQNLHNQTRLISQSLQVKDILSDSSLLDAFHSYCNSEHSAENITLWRKIEEEFKPKEQSERLQIAKKLYSDYLSLDGLHTININEVLKKKVIAQIESNQVDENLYNGVQLELEILMGTDTLARFKLSEVFKVAFQKSALSLHKPLVDEL